MCEDITRNWRCSPRICARGGTPDSDRKLGLERGQRPGPRRDGLHTSGGWSVSGSVCAGNPTPSPGIALPRRLMPRRPAACTEIPPESRTGRGQWPNGSKGRDDASAGGNIGRFPRARIFVPFPGIGPDPRNGPKRPGACLIIPTFPRNRSRTIESARSPVRMRREQSRAEAQILRLSMTYALLDRSPTIQVEHVREAHALWRHPTTTLPSAAR